MFFFSFNSIGVHLNFIATDNSGGGRKVKSHRDFADAKPQSKEPKKRVCERRSATMRPAWDFKSLLLRQT